MKQLIVPLMILIAIGLTMNQVFEGLSTVKPNVILIVNGGK